MAMAYHMDALRQKRLHDRKNEALGRLLNAGSEDPVPHNISFPCNNEESGLRTTDMGQFNQNQTRYDRSLSEISHDTNFNYRVLKGTPEAPIHVDSIYKIIYPGSYYTHKGK